MEMPLSELIDKLSIVKLKIERVGEPHLKVEEQEYEEAVKEFEKKGFKIKKTWLKELKKINGKCWDLEWDVRVITSKENVWEEAKNFGLEELGKRALKVGDLMAERAEIKNRISIESCTGFVDNKVDHVGKSKVN